MAARIIAALCQGAFFGIAAVVGAQLVSENRRTQAIAWIFMGVSLADLLGVPLGTMLGQALGWRSTFWAVSSIGILAIAAIAVFLPARIAMQNSDFNAEFKALLNPGVAMPLAVSVLTSASLFTIFTYIAPLLEQVTMVPYHRAPGILVLLGIGLCIDSLVGGKLGDRNLAGSLIATEFILLAVLISLRFTAALLFPAVVNMFI